MCSEKNGIEGKLKSFRIIISIVNNKPIIAVSSKDLSTIFYFIKSNTNYKTAFGRRCGIGRIIATFLGQTLSCYDNHHNCFKFVCRYCLKKTLSRVLFFIESFLICVEI